MNLDSCLGSVSRVGRLFVVGNSALLGSALSGSRFAVAGSRRGLSSESVAWLRARVDSLDPASHVLVSGLALGADSIAHRRALARGVPQIVVLPGGFDCVAPRSNLGLLQSILASGGCAVSLHPPSFRPSAPDFVARNRVIAGLAHMLLVPGCAPSSGTMHTVRFARAGGVHVLFCASGAPHLVGAPGCSPL